MLKFLKFSFFLFFIQVFCQNPESYNFPKIKSTLTFPIRISLASVSNMVNASVPQLLYEDQSYTDNDNDQFKVKVWKSGNIKISGGKNQNIILEVPIKVWAEKGVGTLGVYSYQNTTFEAVMFFNTSLVFNANWTVVSTTKPMSFSWVTKPVLDYGKIKIPITSLVEKQLRDQQSKFCKTIDEKISTEMDFRNYALTAWNLFTEPFHISEEYHTWLKISPISVSMAPLQFYADVIDTTIGIDAYSEAFMGIQPSISPQIKTVTNFNFVQQIPNRFLFQTTANIPYTEATTIAQTKFVGKEFDFRDGQSKIKVTAIDVYHSDNRLVIEIVTEGDVEGTSIISGIPVYNPERRAIVLSDTTFKLKTKNILQKTATVLFRGKIVKMIEEEYGIPTIEMEESAKKNIEDTFRKDYYKGLKISGKVFTLQPSNVLVGDDALTVVIDTNAELRLNFK